MLDRASSTIISIAALVLRFRREYHGWVSYIKSVAVAHYREPGLLSVSIHNAPSRFRDGGFIADEEAQRTKPSATCPIQWEC